jgi:cytochrome c
MQEAWAQMDSFEFNKLIGALLGAVFVVFSISIVSNAIFASPAPEQFGFAIEAPEEETAESGPAAPAEEPIAVLLASANPEAGAAVFKKCTACHTGESGGANKVGPNLWNIVNRPLASHEGFAYSAAMKEFAQGGSVVWDYEHLSNFLASPKGYIKGTAMGFAGVKKPDERANLIAYLRTLSDSPAPLPEAAAPAAAAEPAAAPEGGAAPAEAAPAAPAEAAPAPEAAPAEPAPAPAEPAPAPAEPAPAQ